jgi:stearoyl-CoA desaturase (delta-9 desaturase)
MASASRYLSIPLPNGSRISLLLSLPFALIHIASLLIFLTPFHWYYLVTCLALLVVRMFFVTAGYHRYFSHRSFKTSRVFQFVIAFMAMTSSQKGVLWWAAHHRHHHRHSDQELDLHSPTLFGFFWSHVGWIISDKYNDTRLEYIGDFAKFPELRWLNKYHLVPPVTLGAALWLIGGWPLFIWGFCLSTVLLWHDTFTINSLSHLFGSRRYETTDTSRNNWLLALLTLGEGWHNNHHHFMASARQGFFWWEIDITYYTLKVLSWFGIVWDLRKVPVHLLTEDRLTNIYCNIRDRQACLSHFFSSSHKPTYPSFALEHSCHLARSLRSRFPRSTRPFLGVQKETVCCFITNLKPVSFWTDKNSRPLLNALRRQLIVFFSS